MQDFEKLGAFYLGRLYDLEQRTPTDELLLYESRDLVTHAVCVGMTGSGKTGLCIALIEEAAIDGVPAVVIDPKGDLSNLLLAFPDLKAADFAPWINPDEAYISQVNGALMDAMLDHAGPLQIGADEWLTIAARGSDTGVELGDFPEEATTVILRVKGSDLAAFREGRMSRDEAKKRIEAREF